MAQVRRDAAVQETIEEYLDYLERAWRAIPSVVTEWDGWDEHSRLVFDLNWAVPEDRLLQLRAWAACRLLTRPQRRRYDALQRLITEHRPDLERLRAS